MTLSLAGRCERTGQFGVVISSSSPAVAARCAFVRAGVGAACSQNITDPRLGPRLLDLIEGGETAEHAMARIVREEPLIAFRQLTCIDASGGAGSHSGERTLGVHSTVHGRDAVAAGNILSSPGVPAAMVAAFERDPELDLGERLLAALRAGIEAGGEAGPVHSAGMLIAWDVPWPVTDLRVDWSTSPIEDLANVWYVWQPQMADYRRRALEPEIAPAYGVPGER